MPGGASCWERVVELDDGAPLEALPANALPEAIDYLDVVWTLEFGHPLFRFKRASSVTGLVADCRSRSDFESRMSDLADVLKSMEIPDKLLAPDKLDTLKGQPLNRAAAAIRGRYDEPEVGAASRALESLRHLNRIRAGLQHSGGSAGKKMAEAFAALRLEYPPRHWGEAWSAVRLVATRALQSVRRAIRRI